jgi:GAF domain-containing protein
MAVSAVGVKRALAQLADLRTSPVGLEAALQRIVETADALFRVDAYDHKQPTQADDLGREERWPAFSPAAARRGLVAVLASPIPYSTEAVGVVAVFASAPHAWDQAEQEAIVAFTDLAAMLILNAMEASEQGRVAVELQGALDSRVVIEQAKGVLVGRHGLSPREAFERLRGFARDQRRPLTEVAEAVVAAAQRP